MIYVSLLIQGTIEEGLSDPTKIESFSMPVHQFKWLIIFSIVAFHGVTSAILTELMGRTYGKYWLWYIICFTLPVIGPVSVWLYHTMLSTATMDARRRVFFERLLRGGPVSLRKLLIKERNEAQEVKLISYNNELNRSKNGTDPELENLISEGKFAEARARAWKVMEIARDSGDDPTTGKYQHYLEIIAEQESIGSGADTANF